LNKISDFVRGELQKFQNVNFFQEKKKNETPNFGIFLSSNLIIFLSKIAYFQKILMHLFNPNGKVYLIIKLWMFLKKLN